MLYCRLLCIVWNVCVADSIRPCCRSFLRPCPIPKTVRLFTLLIPISTFVQIGVIIMIVIRHYIRYENDTNFSLTIAICVIWKCVAFILIRFEFLALSAFRTCQRLQMEVHKRSIHFSLARERERNAGNKMAIHSSQTLNDTFC